MFRTKAGKNYLSLILQDKTGTVPAKVWELNVQIGEFDKGDFIKIDAQVTTFQGDIQLNVQRLRRSMEGEYALYGEGYSCHVSRNTALD